VGSHRHGDLGFRDRGDRCANRIAEIDRKPTRRERFRARLCHLAEVA
jgi:hypothetical protein